MNEQSKSTILIIEDTPEHAELTRRVLAAWGYRVLTAVDGQSGLQAASERQPDLILLDLGLPDVNGENLLQDLRQVVGLETIPVLAVTAWPPGTSPEKVVAAGFSGYVTKPISYSVLGDQIAALLAVPSDSTR